MSISVTKVINMIFITFTHCSYASSGYKAKMVVTFIHITKARKNHVTDVKGRFLDCFVKTRLTSVTAAINAAKGNVVAKPQPWVCGFMTLIHTHINIPI